MTQRMLVNDSQPATARRRSRYSIGIRGLMLLVLVLATFLAWRVNRANTQRTAVSAIAAAHGRVRYDWQSGKPIPGSKAGPSAPAWLRSPMGDEFFQEVVEVDVEAAPDLTGIVPSSTGATDELLATIAGLDRIESLASAILLSRARASPIWPNCPGSPRRSLDVRIDDDALAAIEPDFDARETGNDRAITRRVERQGLAHRSVAIGKADSSSPIAPA